MRSPWAIPNDPRIAEANARRVMAERLDRTSGQCVNHKCPRFEYLVAAERGATCSVCGQLLLAPNGVDYAGEVEDPLASTLRGDHVALD